MIDSTRQLTTCRSRKNDSLCIEKELCKLFNTTFETRKAYAKVVVKPMNCIRNKLKGLMYVYKNQVSLFSASVR